AEKSPHDLWDDVPMSQFTMNGTDSACPYSRLGHSREGDSTCNTPMVKGCHKTLDIVNTSFATTSI
ncbi:hypothetical protein SK128_009179, partial [Halocaridina rubra]